MRPVSQVSRWERSPTAQRLLERLVAYGADVMAGNGGAPSIRSGQDGPPGNQGTPKDGFAAERAIERLVCSIFYKAISILGDVDDSELISIGGRESCAESANAAGVPSCPYEFSRDLCLTWGFDDGHPVAWARDELAAGAVASSTATKDSAIREAAGLLGVAERLRPDADGVAWYQLKIRSYLDGNVGWRDWVRYAHESKNAMSRVRGLLEAARRVPQGHGHLVVHMFRRACAEHPASLSAPLEALQYGLLKGDEGLVRDMLRELRVRSVATPLERVHVQGLVDALSGRRVGVHGAVFRSALQELADLVRPELRKILKEAVL